eukprot:COSAG06_NODE_28647_length_570_cov_1.303609_1_plen_46_part_01
MVRSLSLYYSTSIHYTLRYINFLFFSLLFTVGAENFNRPKRRLKVE